jgi:hypothetical protein
LLLEDALDPIAQGQLRHGTAGARADQVDLHDTFGSHIYKLNVSAVGLKGGTNLIEHCLDLFLHNASFLVDIACASHAPQQVTPCDAGIVPYT